MYKGNMYEYIENLDKYLKENNIGTIKGPTRNVPWYVPSYSAGALIFRHNVSRGTEEVDLIVYDTEDFEDIVLKFIKEIISHDKKTSGVV